MASNFKQIAWNYWHNVQALRDLTRFLSPTHLRRRINELFQSIIVLGQFAGWFAPGQAETLQNILEQFNTLPLEPNASSETPPGDLEQRVKSQGPMQPQLSHALYDLTVLHRVGGFLQRSALVMATSQFEVLLADLFHEFYRVVPEALSGDQKVLSVNDIRRFGNIDEALRYVAAERVDALLKGDLEKWRKAIRDHFKVELFQLFPGEWEQWVEIIQRRNAFVHNDGKVDRAYIEKTGQTHLDIGQPIETTEEYLARAIDSLAIAGVTLVDKCWQKLFREEASQRDELLMHIISNELRDENWFVCKHIAKAGLQRGCANETNKYVFRVNYWYAVKMDGGWEEIESEVNAVDIAACPTPIIAVCIAALRRDHELFFRILPDAIDAGLTQEQLLEWPILAPIREHQRFQEVLRASFS